MADYSIIPDIKEMQMIMHIKYLEIERETRNKQVILAADAIKSAASRGEDSTTLPFIMLYTAVDEFKARGYDVCTISKTKRGRRFARTDISWIVQ